MLGRKILYLDSARGIAALMVLFSHFIGAVNWDVYGMNYIKFLRPLHFGEGAVEFFFVLSGYVLSRKYIINNYFSFFNLKEYLSFIIKRVFRIYPLFLFILFVSFIYVNSTSLYFDKHLSGWFQGILNSFFSLDEYGHLFKNVFLYPKLVENRLMPQDWTLSVELIISISFFPFIFLGKLNSKMLLVSVLVLFKLCGLNAFLFPFILGIFISLNVDKIAIKWCNFSSLTRLLVLIISALTFYSVIFIPMNIIMILNKICINITSIGASGILIIVLCSSKIQKVLNFNLFVYIGEISFGIYLWHFLFIFALMRYLESYGILSVLFGVFLLTILFATITYYFIEKPFIKFGLYFISFIK